MFIKPDVVRFSIEYTHKNDKCVAIMTMWVEEQLKAIMTWERLELATTIRSVMLTKDSNMEHGFYFLSEFQIQANGAGSKEINGEMEILGGNILHVQEVFAENAYRVEDISTDKIKDSRLRIYKDLN